MTADSERIPLDSSLTCINCKYSLRDARMDGNCPECGHLVASSYEPVQVFNAPDAMDAHMVKGLLDGAGIESQIVGENLATGWGGIPVTMQTQPSVWVHSCDRASAEPIVKQFVETQYGDEGAEDTRAPASPWTCPQCGEEVEGNFAACWNCQSARPESD